ncbi:pilus assembly protein N-terminal domain-containing protein [Hyphomonadaceae bacterium BL14]|nr:pilus assembly protein N-terminal domain-containing protein [Hyphomonadaceae bacterium BL14]
MRLCARIAALALTLALTAAAGAPALAQVFRVPADHAALIRLPGEAAAIVVGNPAIADANLYDARTIFITGKQFGRTNLIALNAAGRVLYTADLSVTGNDRGVVQVFRNNTRASYVCAPDCQAIPTLANDAAWNTLDGG